MKENLKLNQEYNHESNNQNILLLKEQKDRLNIYSNENIIKFLTNENRLSVIEDILMREHENYERITKFNNNINKNMIYKKKKKYHKDYLTFLFNEIKNEVDDFLNIRDISYPKIEYVNISKLKDYGIYPLVAYGVAGSCGLTLALFNLFNMNSSFFDSIFSGIGLLSLGMGIIDHCSLIRHSYYLWKDGKIVLNKMNYYDLIPTLIHEYDHHIVYKKLHYIKLLRLKNDILKNNYIINNEIKDIIDEEISDKISEIYNISLYDINEDGYFNFGYFIEGHARGLERIISSKYGERYKDDNFIKKPTIISYEEILSTYNWLLKKLDKDIDNKIIKDNSLKNKLKNYQLTYQKPSIHALGTTFFLILEDIYGKNIYSDILNLQTDRIKIE